jgi:predicted nucleic acid-binding protein
VKVVDASLAAKWIVTEDDSNHALALYEHWAAQDERMVAVHLLPFEITNILRKKMRREDLPLEAAQEALARLLAMPIQLRPGPAQARARLHRDALDIAARFDLPATYDAHYLALAASLRCELWTADERLLNQLRRRLPYVHGLSEFRDG